MANYTASNQEYEIHLQNCDLFFKFCFSQNPINFCVSLKLAMMPFKEQKIFKTVSFECNTGHKKHFIHTELDFHFEKFLFLTKFDEKQTELLKHTI